MNCIDLHLKLTPSGSIFFDKQQLVSNWLCTPPLTEPEENALVCEPTVRMMGTVDRFMHRRIQHCSVFLKTRQWQAPSVWLLLIASGSESRNSRAATFKDMYGYEQPGCYFQGCVVLYAHFIVIIGLL
ncbi:hypothetical protein SAMN02910276_00730 [Butyrivibrio sp. Su6]|nr:hypothetical protein SAMN02910276_00730 [Butyrivibrio sp. Su6]